MGHISHISPLTMGMLLGRAMVVVGVVVAVMMMAVEGADPTQSKCGKYTSCGPCVKAKGCGWCKTPVSSTNGTLSVVGCVEGSFSSGKGVFKHRLCGQAVWDGQPV